jgi:RNA polymerase sigma factor (sigma-70 family)
MTGPRRGVRRRRELDPALRTQQGMEMVEGVATVGASPRSDERLWAEVQHGSGAAFGVVFDRHAKAIYNHCFRRVASWEAAEDLMSVTFLEAWRLRGRARMVDGSVLPWLYGIATNVCRNQRRSHWRYRRLLSRLNADVAAPDHAADVASRIDDERRMAEVRVAIRQLPRGEREVVELVLWAGLDYASAAVALDIPIGTVRSRLSRARNRLVGTLSGLEETEES